MSTRNVTSPTIAEARTQFAAAPGYVSACTAGLPPRATLKAMAEYASSWATGSTDLVAVGDDVERCRATFARIAGVSPDRVAVASQTSQLVSVVASSLPDGAEVLCVEGDFASLTHPFEQQRHRGVRVQYVPLADLAIRITASTELVAFSLVQSASGAIAPHEEIVAAARGAGARTLTDLTQSLGWLPVQASHFDYTVCHAYKWLCAPRGTAFLTIREGLDETLMPIAAGWYSADNVWDSCYAGHTPLAASAARFDLSPAWPVIGGTLASLEFIASLDITEVHAHAVGLANAARAALELPSGTSAIVTWTDRDGRDLAALHAAGLTASGRSGNARVAFHLWNTATDVSLLAEALNR